ncbi:MAG: nickel-dependent lactate racemase [Eubacteriales bacterium]|nr:nickel-dependent lactate racemase [Eubacteriales bacterium]
MKIEFGYGKSNLSFDIDEENIIKILQLNCSNNITDETEEIEHALNNPIGTGTIGEIFKPGEKIVIITSDITRPMPTRVVLPVLVNRLIEAGCSESDMTVVFALGNHRKHTEEEKKYLMGEALYGKIKCLDSDVTDCVAVGSSKSGTPYEIFKKVAEADRRICLGNIEYHYFAGYSGGAKAIMPGVSTPKAIQANHSKMILDAARAGYIDGNPVRQDIDDVADFVPIDFIINVVLDEKKRILKAFAGHHISAHREGCKYLDSLYSVGIPKRAEIVITTPGGYPKDINVYQAQKSLDNAKHAVKDGGIIIFVAQCAEGLGEKVFERWINEAESPEDIINKICSHFELGGHKAAAIALVQKKARIYMVSDLDDSLVRKMFMVPFDSVDDALKSAFKECGRDAGVIIMPYGGSTLPCEQNLKNS